MFVYDLNLQAWNCWKMPSVSMAIWTGLTGGGSEVQAARLPGTAEDKEGVGGVAWSNIERIKAADESYASCRIHSGEHSHYAKATNFGFSIPSTATVTGVAVAVRRRLELKSVGLLQDLEVKLVKGGVVEGENKAELSSVWLHAITQAEYGGPEALWGLALTPTNVNASNFGAVIAVQGSGPGVDATAEIDAIFMAVYYLSAESSSGVRPRLFCSQSKTVFWTGPSAVEEAAFPGWAWQSGLYDLGSDDEKELVKAKVWGEGNIKVAVSEDFKAMKERHEFQMGEVTTQKSQNISQKATLFSHRFEGTGKASVQRFVRYLRTTATSGSQSDPS
jgi:hypothetical protein